MAPQLQINQGPQDALLFDNTKSYFTNVGYTRTSNFQMELRDISSQNNAALGQTVQWVIPKAADLLGPVDLVCEFAAGTAPGTTGAYSSFVEAVGHAMIEKITLSVGSNDIETICIPLLDSLFPQSVSLLFITHCRPASMDWEFPPP